MYHGSNSWVPIPISAVSQEAVTNIFIYQVEFAMIYPSGQSPLMLCPAHAHYTQAMYIDPKVSVSVVVNLVACDLLSYE